jgi:uncharacterized membrane protein YcaP (DUF421 family)
MSSEIWQLAVTPIEIVIRTAIVYLLFLIFLRISGKRQLGQFTLFDIALVLLVANALQPAMTGPDQSLTGGVIIIITIFALNRLVAEARLRIPLVRRLLEFEPTVIGREGRWLKDELEEQGIDVDDVDAALREHGLERADQMKLAVLEEDGSISIVPADGEDNPAARRRSRRYKRSAF